MTLLEASISGWPAVIWTISLIALSAFFVAAEFALMSAKPHRLEARAGTLPGRAALKNSAELTIVLIKTTNFAIAITPKPLSE